jgi:CrcB protein
MTVLYLAAGGALGTIARYYAGIWAVNAFEARAAGTFVVNIVGSLLIGAFLGAATTREWPDAVVVLVAIGVLGGFTTFSTFSWQTLQLLEDGNAGGALLNVVASLVVGLAAVWVGATAARAVS